MNTEITIEEEATGVGAPDLDVAEVELTDAEAGQATAEYALIIAAAAAIAALLLTWAARTDAIGRLFNAVLDHVIGSI